MDVPIARSHRVATRLSRLSEAGVDQRDFFNRKEEKDDNLQFSPVQPATIYVYNNTIKSWYEFMAPLGDFEQLTEDSELPDFEKVKGWLRWIAYTSCGRDHKNILRSTLITYWSRFCEAIYRLTKKRFSEELRMRVNLV